MATRKTFQNRTETLVTDHEIADLGAAVETLSVVACRLQWIWVDNSGSGNVNYLKIWDQAATPVPATDTPNIVLMLPAGYRGALQLVPAGSSGGLNFLNGFHICATNSKGLGAVSPTPEVDVSIGLI